MSSTQRTGQKLYERARHRIPGGTQLLSKRPEVFLPEQWPSYYSRAQGAEIWDLDGNRYVDMSINGIGACILGYSDPEVNAAVHAAVEASAMATLNCPEEVELADLLCEIHPWADMVRYGRCGGEAMAIAARIARASTGRDKIAFCGYHGWHDWYLAANLASDHVLDGHLLSGLSPRGVPRGLLGTAFPFRYNQLQELEAILDAHAGEIGAIILEPLRQTLPQPGFLEGVRKLADRSGAVMVFDEVSMGFRLTRGGAHLQFNVEPDMAVFAKAISNGHAMAAVIGRESVMQAAQSTFVSSTYWTERIGPAAALATLRKHRRENVHVHLAQIGVSVRKGWARAAESTGLSIKVAGIDPLPYFEFNDPNALQIRTLFTQLMLERGYLDRGHLYVTFAHKPEMVDQYLATVEVVFRELEEAIRKDRVGSMIKGPVAHTGFQRLA
ncbi:MAG: aminotransferase class III-fold pyridoxal phosphate-dependent enzyme [Acidimicrobiia bacterium]|nr:aminotransferase class III-fold pyridoxal phosphate-dependent enzyme [Acidimicrobiia bacterium]